MPIREWDLFLAHASEDKAFTDRLANELVKFGLAVWYDKFEIKAGDSISRKIDEGLVGATRGVIVLSRSFFQKRWTEREYRGLVAKEVADQPAILPIWHGVTRDDVLAWSPSLADARAIDTTTRSVGEIALEIASAVRPDLVAAGPAGSGSVVLLDPTTTIPGPIRHIELSRQVLNRITVIREVFLEVLDQPIEEVIDNFRRDTDPETELEVWEAMAAIYLRFAPRLRNFNDRKRLFGGLLAASSLGVSGAEADIGSLPRDLRDQVRSAIEFGLVVQPVVARMVKSQERR